MIPGSRRVLREGYDGLYDVYISPTLRIRIAQLMTMPLAEAADTINVVHTLWYNKRDGPFSVRLGDDIVNLVARREDGSIEYRVPEEP